MNIEQYIAKNGKRLRLVKFKRDMDTKNLLAIKVFQELEKNGYLRKTNKKLINCNFSDFGIKECMLCCATYNFYFIMSD